MTRALSVAAVIALGALCATPANAVPLTFTAELSGPAEFPANASPGTGVAKVIIDSVAHTMSVFVKFEDLLGVTTVSHIHVVPPGAVNPVGGVATTLPTFPGFPAGVSAGTYFNIFDMTLASSYGAAFLANNGGTTASAEAALFGAIQGGKAYLNVHSNLFPGGEIRGFLAPVPEPGTMLLLGSGVAALGLKRRRASRG